MSKILRAAATAAGMLALLAGSATGSANSALASAQIRPAAAVPNPGQSDRLGAVTAIARNNAWAVGYYCPSKCTSTLPPQRYMILHWNGKAWTLALTGPGSLDGISAAGPRDIWAVGGSNGSPLFLHWNGRTWSRGKAVTFPPVAGFSSVTTLTASNAWAVGSAYSYQHAAYTTLIAHWNGAKWSIVPSPPLTVRDGDANLSTVSADSGTDAWAAGNYCITACLVSAKASDFRAAIVHWNGSKWSPTSLPVRNSFDISVVDALSRSNAWAIGETLTAGNIGHSLMLHWNGSHWLQVAIPNNYPSAMTFISPTDGWAVGLAEPSLHWNGMTWKAGAPVTPNWGGAVSGASGDAANDVWGVGERCVQSQCQGFITRGFIVHWNGIKWSVL